MKTPGFRLKLAVGSIALAFACGACLGCSKKSDDQKAQAQEETPPPPPPPPAETAAPQPAAAAAAAPAEVPVPGPGAVEAKASGTLTVIPTPVPVCDKTGTGVGIVTWTVHGAKNIEVHLDRPDGTLFAADNKPAGSQKSGPWIKKDLVLYLQLVDNNYPRTADYTLAKLTVPVVGGGPCPR